MSDINETNSNPTPNPGVFALPSLNKNSEGNSLINNDARQGAIQSMWTSSDDLATEPSGALTDDQFPMIVWLRGDEPWFDQFNMDADAVMKTLGIKRSRLTQIAGRELRVGRVRVDRYIRPVFRSLDVERYLEQTRATASHQKSSDAIKAATDSLQQQINQFENTLEAIGSNLTSQINSVLATQLSEAVGQANLVLLTRLDTVEADITNRLSVMLQDSLIKNHDALARDLRESACDTKNHMRALENEFISLLTNQTTMLDKALQDASAIENRMSNLELTVKNLQSRLLERLDLAWEKLAKLEAMAQAAQEQHDKVRLTSKQHEQIHQLRTAQRAAPCRRRARGFK